MNDENATIRSLNELKTLFDSGAITSEEYEALKKRIIFGTAASADPTGLRNPEPNPPVPTSSSVSPIETKVIYPTELPIVEPPVTWDN